MLKLRNLKHWYTFASRVWKPLACGWLAVPLSATPYLSLDRAGALLICGVIIAEVFHDKGHRRFVNQVQPGQSTQYIYLEVDADDKPTKNIEITAQQYRSGKVIVNTDSWTIYHLAKPKEFFNQNNGRMWYIDQTMDRLEKVVDYIIVFSAVVGTILWAFA